MALGVTIDQIVLWEPALTQRALAAEPNLDEPHKDPLGHEHFARAHETVNRIVVLHTPYDGVLGPRPTDADKDDERLDEWLVEELHGVYAWRYLVSGQLDNLLPTKQVEDPHEPTVPGHTPRYTGASQDRELAREQLRTRLQEAAEQANDLSALQRQGRMPLPQLDRLAPWGHWLTFSDADINTIAERLEALYDAYHSFESRHQPADNLAAALVAMGGRYTEMPLNLEPAMGHSGPYLGDEQTRELRDNNKLEIVNQGKLLQTHSGFLFPDEQLFEEIYKEQVWKRFLSDVGFGQY